MDITYLLFLQKIREATGEIFDGIMLQLTELAEPTITFLVFAAVYWCINKRAGQFMGFQVAFTCTLNQFLKAVCKVERPWVMDERIQPVEAALPAAAGYSFPSGHSTRAVAVWGAAGYQAWKGKKYRPIGAFCWGLVALILFSRNYLGVHTLKDVLAALFIGVFFLFVGDWILSWLEQGKNRDIVFCMAGCVLLFLPMLKIGCMSNTGAGMGILLGWLIERRWIRFETGGSRTEKILRFSIGGVLILAILQVVKSVLLLFMQAKYASFFTMFLLNFFIMAVYPYFFSALHNKKRIRGGIALLFVIVIVLTGISVVKVKNIQSEEQRTEQEITMEKVEEQPVTDVEATVLEEEPMQVIAHRGYSSVFPENTMASFSGAIDLGVDYIETDVQMTKDGEIVIFHDDLLTRITGAEGKISDYTYEELSQMDAGNWFSSEFAGAKIPTLREFLELVKSSDVKIYLELKDIGEAEGFEESVLEIVKEYEMTERCVFASFNYGYLQKLKELSPDIQVLYNTNAANSMLPTEFPAEYYGLNIQTVTAEAVGAVHASGGQVFVWTADTPEQIKNVRKMGVDGIVTNRPGVAKVMVHPEYDFLAEHYEKSITVPGLYEQNLPEKCGDMVMQGLTRTTGNFVISAYSASGAYNSILYIMDLNGKLQKIVDLGFMAHTGGIAYDEAHDLLWVTGPEGMVYGLSWSSIINDTYTGEIGISFDAGLQNHNQAKVASFLTLYQGKLYVGSYVDGANGTLNCYDVTEPLTPVLLSAVTIPERIQGVTFQEDATSGMRYIIFSQGYQMEDAHLLRFVYDEQVQSYEEPQELWTLPEGAEQVLMTANGLYILFESSARPYRETARVVNDQIYLVRM